MKQNLVKKVLNKLLNESPIVNKRLPIEKQKELEPAASEWEEENPGEEYDDFEKNKWLRRAGIRK
jgi:hypothetical protein